MKPRVFVDCRWVGRTGLGRYVDNLMSEMTQLDHGLSIVAGVLRTSDARPRWLDAADTDVLEIDSPWFTFGEQYELPRLLRRARIDLAHFTNFNVPIGYRGPCVTTVHDLTLIDHPTSDATVARRLSYRGKVGAMRLALRGAVRDPRSVVVPTEFGAGEIRRRFGVSGDRIAVTPYAPTELPPTDSVSMADLGVRRPFVLSVGTAYPHKNLSRLLEAMGQLDGESSPVQLVLVGPEDAHQLLVRAEVVQRGLEDRVVMLGHVDDSVLGALFRAADSYAFPSLSEGFGLPGLEAMAAGVPVASSSATCLPEVFGDGVIYFDPTDVSEMAAAIQQLHDDESLRQRLIVAGRRRAAAFTWRRTADLTLEVYRSALAVAR